jgi:hypothetical protein
MHSFFSTVLKAVAVSFLLGGVARAQIAFPSFGAGDIGAGANQLTLNGTAVLNGNAIRLTAPNIGEAGTAFYNTRQGLLSGFSTTFRYEISGEGQFGPADGLVFLVSNDPLGTSALANGGSELGFIGMTNTLGVTVDTFSEVGVRVLTSAGNELAFVPKTLVELQGVHDVRVDFQNAVGGVGDLTVFFDSAPTISLAAFDMNPYLDGSGTAQTGFSAGTGLLAENHDIVSWSLQTGATAIPEPATLTLIALGPVGLLTRRRR